MFWLNMYPRDAIEARGKVEMDKIREALIRTKELASLSFPSVVALADGAEDQYDDLLAYVERLEGYLDERNTMVAATKERYWGRPKWLAQPDAVSPRTEDT